MIIEKLIDFMFVLPTWFVGLFNVPHLDSSILDGIGFLSTLMESAKGLISLFMPWSLAKFVLIFVISVNAFELVYWLVMWVLKKIPMVGIN